jgi:hypothetical protein
MLKGEWFPLSQYLFGIYMFSELLFFISSQGLSHCSTIVRVRIIARFSTLLTTQATQKMDDTTKNEERLPALPKRLATRGTPFKCFARH